MCGRISIRGHTPRRERCTASEVRAGGRRGRQPGETGEEDEGGGRALIKSIYSPYAIHSAAGPLVARAVLELLAISSIRGLSPHLHPHLYLHTLFLFTTLLTTRLTSSLMLSLLPHLQHIMMVTTTSPTQERCPPTAASPTPQCRPVQPAFRPS